MLEVHAILQRQRCNENITKKTGTLSDAYRNETLENLFLMCLTALFFLIVVFDKIFYIAQKTD